MKTLTHEEHLAQIKKNKKSDKVATTILSIIVAFISLVLVSVIVYIVARGLPYLSWDFITKNPESFKAGGGIGPQIFNSFYLLFLTMLISIPLSLGGAIYLTQYAPQNALTGFVKLAIETLSSLPSIVVGLFGYLFFVIKFGWGFSILSGSIALTMFNLPIMVRVIQQSLEAVPAYQRDAGLALGLTRWETTIHILIPEALAGIITGIILCAGRVFGEAAALIYTSGQSAPEIDLLNFNLTDPSSAWNIMRPAETLAVHIWKVNSEGVIPDVDIVSAGTAAFLMICVLLFNVAARAVGASIQKKVTAK
ncbi:MAG: phosphate ABC transporter permease PstA [Coriobacteriia bacterium]|nr:phosphate ABC transporter permease PstA [Coriobacteriia bacterium]